MPTDLADFKLWDIFAARLKAYNTHPTDVELAAAIRQAPIPESLREYVASRVDGTWLGPKRRGPRGKRLSDEVHRDHITAILKRDTLDLWHAIYAAERPRTARARLGRDNKTPRERAEDYVGRLWGIGPRQLRRDLAKAARENPGFKRTAAERSHARAVSRMLAAEYIALPTDEDKRAFAQSSLPWFWSNIP